VLGKPVRVSLVVAAGVGVATSIMAEPPNLAPDSKAGTGAVEIRLHPAIGPVVEAAGLGGEARQQHCLQSREAMAAPA
jgi:hypothetical protein